MRLPRFEYVRPQALEEALSVLAQSGSRAKILAGGTDLLVNMKQRTVCPESCGKYQNTAGAFNGIIRCAGVYAR